MAWLASSVAAVLAIVVPHSSAQVAEDFCTSLQTCVAYGKLPCDRNIQHCPPCIYIDTKGQTLCYDQITGTKLCPFLNTTADCSGGETSSVPPLRNKTPSIHGDSTTLTPPRPHITSNSQTTVVREEEDPSSWNGLSIGLMVVVVVLASALAVAVFKYTQYTKSSAAQHHHRTPSTPIHGVKNSCSSCSPPDYQDPSPFMRYPASPLPQLQLSSTMTTTMMTTPLVVAYFDTLNNTSSIASSRSVSLCHIMESPREDDNQTLIRPSGAF
ncbi:hypothetical protein DYB31_009173 [Aphanomyces astaci]|uniref:Uncharacterized protein n=1 Tax=Aphanomyces astaci TaxID=112090 RepID=A0A397FYH7_APHAT|nr:hypothetical protein DYB31_009173 [Aphanomyces astaci]